MTAFDEARAELVNRGQQLDQVIAETQAALARLQTEKSIVAARIETMDLAVRLLNIGGEADPTPDGKRQKRDVRGAVRACLDAGPDTGMTEREITAHTALPVMSVKSYLLRAARSGELRRVNDRYSLRDPTPAPLVLDVAK